MKKIIIVAALCTVVLTACGSKTDANEKNFSAALTQYFEKHGELCLQLGNFPVNLSEMDIQLQKSIPYGPSGKMAALEAVGLVSGVVTENVKRYTLTDAGKKFYREKEVEFINLVGGTKKMMQGDLCYGKQSLEKIVKWDGPIKLGDYQEAPVTYLYRIDGLVDWAKRPELQAAFPVVGQLINDAGKVQQAHGVKLTSQGWEALGL